MINILKYKFQNFSRIHVGFLDLKIALILVQGRSFFFWTEVLITSLPRTVSTQLFCWFHARSRMRNFRKDDARKLSKSTIFKCRRLKKWSASAIKIDSTCCIYIVNLLEIHTTPSIFYISKHYDRMTYNLFLCTMRAELMLILMMNIGNIVRNVRCNWRIIWLEIGRVSKLHNRQLN